MVNTDKLDTFIRCFLANNDYSLKDCYKCFFDILTYTDKFDNELSRSLKFDKLLIVTDLKFLATSTGEFKFDQSDYNSDSNDLNQISKIKLLRKITSLIKEQDAISNCKMRTEYFLRLKDFDELSLLEISKTIYLNDRDDTTMEMFVKTPFIDALQAKEKKEEKIKKGYQMEIKKLSGQKGYLEAQLKSSKSQITRLKRQYEESQEELEEAKDLAETWKGKCKKKGKRKN